MIESLAKIPIWVFQWAIAIFTLVLIVGACLEYEDLIKKLWLLSRLCLRERSRPYARNSLRRIFNKHSLHSIGALMVVAGIGGELLFEGGDFLVENRETQEANSKIVAAQTKATESQAKLAQLQLKMLAIFGPRHLDDTAKERIAGKLKALAGVKVDVYTLAVGNPFSESEAAESKVLALELVDALQRARFDAVGWLAEQCFTTAASNVVVVVPSDDPTFKSQGSIIIGALEPEVGTYPQVEQFGLACQSTKPLTPHKSSRSDDANIRIVVGRKIPTMPTAETLGIDVPKQ